MTLPLPALLSQALVAFTIEFDNEAETRIPHRTTRHGSTGASGGPWLVSMVMWFNCMRFVGDERITVGQVEQLARAKTNWNGMERWGYIVVEPDPADGRAKPPHADWVVRATPRGRMAREVWRTLFHVIETRWDERFGGRVIEQLRAALGAVISRIDTDLPDCLPILGYGLVSRVPDAKGSRGVVRTPENTSDVPLPALLSKVLLALALEYEEASQVSLAIGANVLRLINERELVRDLPRRAGVSKEAVAAALGFLEKRGYAVVETGSAGGRAAKVVTLTGKGRRAREDYGSLVAAIEQRWQARFGPETVRTLHELLSPLMGEPLLRCVRPYPDGWRAAVPPLESLPHFPMVLHRGGYPDGS